MATLPSKTRLVSVAASVVAVLSVIVGGFVALPAAFGVVGVDGPPLQPRWVTQTATGVGLVVFGWLVFRVGARRDLSSRTDDEESHSEPSSEMLWPW